MLSFTEFQEILKLPSDKSAKKLQKSDTQFSLILKDSLQSKQSQSKLEVQNKPSNSKKKPVNLTKETNKMSVISPQINPDLSKKYKNPKSKSKS